MRSNTNHGSSHADDVHVLLYSPASRRGSKRGAARWIHCGRSALTCLRGPMSWNAATTEQRHQKREKEQQRTSRSGSGAALSSGRYFGQILRHNISSCNRVLDVLVADAPCVGFVDHWSWRRTLVCDMLRRSSLGERLVDRSRRARSWSHREGAKRGRRWSVGLCRRGGTQAPSRAFGHTPQSMSG